MDAIETIERAGTSVNHWNAYLDETYPLEGLNCCPLSLLLKRGDPVAYQVGYQEFCEANESECPEYPD